MQQGLARVSFGGLGAVAQLGEHHTGSVGVRGSIPRRSTKNLVTGERLGTNRGAAKRDTETLRTGRLAKVAGGA